MNNNQRPSNIPPRRPNGNVPPRPAVPPTQNARPVPPRTAGAPANRNPQRQTPQKPKMTAEQARINKENRAREKARAQKRRQAAFKLFLARLAIFGVILVLVAAIGAGLFWLNLTKVEDNDSSRYSYTIGDNKYSVPFKEAVRDGRVYVSFSDVAELCDLSAVGSVDDLKYVIKGDEAETIRFVVGSRIVYVNGVEARLGADCYYEGDELYVPVDFVEAYFKGLNITVNENKHEVEISRIITNLNDKGKLPRGEEPEYAKLSFLLQSSLGIPALDETQEAMAQMPDLGFTTNLLVYEQYMNPGNTDEFLTLVSVNNKLSSSYVPQDLYMVEGTRNDGRAKQQLRLNAAMALEALFKEMAAAGYDDVTVTSAYRSYSYQEQLFNQYLAQHNNDYAYVSTFSNPPGSSEHQTGLCLDMHNLPAADKAFGQTDAFKWLKENCWKFGFILRYPEDKVDITGISYEPWHYRYVGRYHAQRMYQANMCLEEYLAYIGGAN